MRSRPVSQLLLMMLIAGCQTTQEREPLPQAPQSAGQVFIDRVTNDPERESGLRVSSDGRKILYNFSATSSRGRRCSWVDEILSRCVPDMAIEYGRTSIGMMELGSPGKSIVSPQENTVDPTWFPNSEDFAYSVLQGGQAMLGRSELGVGGGAIQFISPTPCAAYDRQPSISPDGRRVLFTAIRPGEGNNVALMDLRTTTEKCKILFPGQLAQWDPRGQRFVFTRVVSNFEQVFVFSESRNLLTQITFGEFNNTTPSWSPNGNRVVFATDRNGSWDVYTIGVEGTDLVQVTTGPTDDYSPTWAPDGSIYFVSNADQATDIWKASFQARQ